MHAVIYARFSSHAQTEQSIEGQLRVCREYAERKGYIILDEYIDRAMTGTNDNRPEFQRMISDSSKKEFEYIIVYKFDRFSRNKYDNAVYKHKLQQNGVRVISAMEEISNTPEGTLMEGLLEMFAEMYSKDLSQKIKRGMRESILKGHFIGGSILYGYKVGSDKKIYIDEEKAKVIKFIFEEYAKGTRKIEIVKMLANKGIRNNKGKMFTKQGIQYILTNDKYIGQYKRDVIENNNYYPAIVDEKLYNKVQEKLTINKRFTMKSKEQFLLSGKVFCGHCGANMIGVSGTSHTGKTYHYYSCYSKHKYHNCSKKNENKERLEDEVFEKICNKLLQKDMINQITDGIIKEYENNITYKKIQELENKISNIEKQFDKISNQIIKLDNDEIIERLNRQANDLTEQQQIYKTEIKKLKLAMQVKHTREDIKEYLLSFLDQPKDDHFKQKIFDIFVTAVYVFDDYLNVYIDMFNENNKITFENAVEHKQEAENRFAYQNIRSTTV